MNDLLNIRRDIQLDSSWLTQGRSRTTELFVCMFVLFFFLNVFNMPSQLHRLYIVDWKNG